MVIDAVEKEKVIMMIEKAYYAWQKKREEDPNYVSGAKKPEELIALAHCHIVEGDLPLRVFELFRFFLDPEYEAMAVPHEELRSGLTLVLSSIHFDPKDMSRQYRTACDLHYTLAHVASRVSGTLSWYSLTAFLFLYFHCTLLNFSDSLWQEWEELVKQ